jgi:hypothetical protein
MGQTPLTRLRLRDVCILASFVVAAAAGAFWLAGASDGNTRGAAASRHGGVRPAPASLPRVSAPFFRAVYRYGGTSLSPAREGARYRVMILNQSDAAIIPRLKAGNPGLRVLMYVDMMGADTRDPDGKSDWAGYADATANHPDWFLRGANGNPLVFKHYPTGRVMDVGNAAYQDAGAARVSSEAKAAGFDGVFLDDANASLDWVISGGEAACVAYPTTAKWQAAVYSFLASVAPQLHQAGLLVVANIGGSTITPGLWQKWNGPLDGAMEESFTNGGAGRASIANRGWTASLGHALWSETNGKIALDHAVTATRGGARYGLATMLLVAGGRNLFSASRSSTHEVWWPEYTTTNALGSPLGRYRKLRNGAYRRDFTHGVVLVNPHAKGARVVRLGATYRGSGLGSTRSVTLPPTTGVVLVRS